MNLLDLCRTRVLLADGAMGTELQRAGLPVGQPGELWNLEHPDRVEAIHRAYADAGANLVLTNTFGANQWVLGRYGLADSVEPIARAAAQTARRAVSPGMFVVGDIGPSGALLKPLGDATEEDLHDAFLAQAKALLAGGADGIIVETMSALEEAVAGVRAAREAGAPFVIASMAFDKTKDGRFRTMMGVAPERAAQALAGAGADVIGANCGTNMAVPDFAQLAVLFCSVVARPVIIQPNAGRPELVEGKAAYRVSPDDFAAGVRTIVEAGVRIVGGCCGTTPAHIGAVRQMIDAQGMA